MGALSTVGAGLIVGAILLVVIMLDDSEGCTFTNFYLVCDSEGGVSMKIVYIMGAIFMGVLGALLIKQGKRQDDY